MKALHYSRFGRGCSFFGFALAFVNANAVAQITVTDWDLETAVQDLSLGGGQDVAFSFTVTNPFGVVQAAQLGPGTATTSYDFSWSGDDAVFRIDAAHIDPDLGSFFYASISQGNMTISTTAPLRAHFTGAYNYSLPMPAADVSTSFRVQNALTGFRYLNGTGLNDTIVHPPPLIGSFAWDQTAIIPADTTCFVLYTMELVTRQNSGLLATGNGFFNLTLEPVPEPATLAVIAIGLIAARNSTRVRKNPHCR